MASSRNKAKYKILRADLIRRGYTLRSFAIKNGYSLPTVYLAAKGHRNGVISTQIRQKLSDLVSEPIAS